MPLHEDVQLEFSEARAGEPTQPADLEFQPGSREIACRGTGAVTDESDVIRVHRRHGEHLGAVPADQERHSLCRGAERDIANRVVLALHRHGLPSEELADDHRRLGESLCPHRKRSECKSEPLVLGPVVPGAKAELEPTSRPAGECRCFLRKDNGMTKVVVQDERAEAYAGGRGGNRSARRDRRQNTGNHMVADSYRLEPELLSLSRFPAERLRIPLP